MPIKILDPKVVARIAAGEVVERPASVVKELVENSLDAGSTQITVETRGGGISLIRVIDNGTGIPAGEVGLAFDRYATSKVSGLDDLDSISTLGFRGEALPSIAAVAQVEVVTCTEDDTSGSFLSLKDGSIVERGSQGRPRGTTVNVRNLFGNVPARLKFLKSATTENSRIANVVSQYALAYPEVRFVLLVDGRVALRTTGSGQLIDSVTQVYGADIARKMVEIKNIEPEWEGSPASSSIRITGVVGLPEVGRSSRDYLSFFVNRRWVSSRLLSWAVEEAYHGLLMVGKHPVAVVNISMSTREVDVNIHPAKTEVKFQNERAVFVAVQKAVRRALVNQAPVPGIEEVATKYSSPTGTVQVTWEPGTKNGVAAPPATAPLTPSATLPVLWVLGQFMRSYIIAEGPDGLYLIDQHAAHERILFERVMAEKSRQAVEVQGLLEPATLEVSPQQEELLKDCRGRLAEFGFDIEPFGSRTYLVRTVPAPLHNRDWKATVIELLESATAQGDWTEKIAMSIACHSAIRAGQSLTGDEMREMVRQLERTSLPRSCPHGRPTMLQLSAERLRKEFGRTG